jgi:hypothetical protein
MLGQGLDQGLRPPTVRRGVASDSIASMVAFEQMMVPVGGPFMQFISVAAMRQAIVFLYNRIQPPRYEEGDLDRYAAIGSFLTNEDAFKAAMREVAGQMLELLKGRPEEFEIAVNGGVHARQMALGAARTKAGFTAQAKMDLEQRTGQQSILTKKEPKQPKKGAADSGVAGHNALVQRNIDEQISVIETREAQFLKSHPGFFTSDSDAQVFVRKFHFHRLLKALEQPYGFLDRNLILMGDYKEFARVLNDGEVWKDSIAPTHGEYSHRLQWLAVARHFRVDRDAVKAFSTKDILRLYKGCANAMRSKYTAYYTDNAAVKTVASTLWNFLFDCFVQSHDAPTIWDGTVNVVDLSGDRTLKILNEDEKVFAQTLRACGRSDSFRAPANVTTMLRTDASMELLHAYIACSQLKTELKKDNPQGLPAYRKDRLTEKYKGAFRQGSISFLPPASASVDIKDVVM